MIKNLDISGVHLEVGPDLKKYAAKKIGRLDRYIPQASRAAAQADIKLKEGRAKRGDERTCEIILHLPEETLTVSETTINIFAAIDIAEMKLRHQLKKYKELHANPRLRQRMITRFKHRPETNEQ